VKKETVVSIQRPTIARDALTDVLREGAQKLLAEAVQAEVESFIDEYQELRDEQGRQRMVRNGYLPERDIQTGLGGIKVRIPRTRDRNPGNESEEPIRFRSSLIPPYLRRSKRVEELLPLLYLKGISTGDFREALSALLGSDATGLSARTISRLKQKWMRDYEKWQQRDLSKKNYVYVWADGIHCNVRMEDARLCLLILIGARADGKKELIAVEDGYRESEQSWWELLRDLQSRGLTIEPKLAIGDGALGFWKALAKVYGNTRQQRCWMHKTGNVLNYLPKAVQPKAKQALHQIWLAETREDAYRAFDEFIATYQLKHPKATACLAKDREELLAFYDFPAEHWVHLRTTNPVESTFATVRLRTAKTRGCLSRQTMLTMVFKLCRSAERRWFRLRGYRRLGEVIENVRFVNGVREHEVAA
jgi:transposase-like protein